MSPFDPSDSSDPDDDVSDPHEDTERFTLQACPHCGAVAPVRLCLSIAACEFCGATFEVAPLAVPMPVEAAAPSARESAGVERAAPPFDRF
jgi:hypothetical protein